MKSSPLRAACATFFVLGLPLAAAAGPGDPRLVSGAVEWPAVLTNEPFVIVRGNDGLVYYVTLAATRREGTVTAGTHISVLGLEGRHRHEIAAVGIGTGSTAEIALAQLQDVRPSSPASPAVPTNDVVTPSTAKPAVPSSRQSISQSPKTAETAVSAPAAAAQSPKPATGAPAPAPDSIALVTPVPIVATPPKVLSNDNARWVEIVGDVETISGGTLVLKVDGGRVSVDVSGLRANLERSLAPGTKLRVYGVPVDDRFKAMGFIEPDARPRGPRKN
jgi:hypothetical protein